MLSCTDFIENPGKRPLLDQLHDRAVVEKAYLVLSSVTGMDKTPRWSEHVFGKSLQSAWIEDFVNSQNVRTQSLNLVSQVAPVRRQGIRPPAMLEAKFLEAVAIGIAGKVPDVESSDPESRPRALLLGSTS
jgi:hypothetical protein